MNCPLNFVVMALNLYSVENWYILVRLMGKRKLKESRLFRLWEMKGLGPLIFFQDSLLLLFLSGEFFLC